MIKKVFLSNKGSTLIEALLALTFAVVIITAVVIAVTTTLSNSNFTKNQNLATQYAQEGLDIARYVNDSDYLAFRALDDSKEYCPDRDGFLTPSEETSCFEGDFIKSIKIDHSGGVNASGGRACQVINPIPTYVSSEVSWTDSRCNKDEYCHKVVLDTCLSDLDQLENP